MKNLENRWQQLYNQVPLHDVPRHFASLRTSPFLMQYLTTILSLCPRGARSCEAGIGSGYSAIWLSQRGVLAEGFDNVPPLVERARQVNSLLGGQAAFRVGDLFSLHDDLRGVSSGNVSSDSSSSGDALKTDSPFQLYDVIHHQGVLEHFTVPFIHAALAQQVALARHVVFSVPSVYYTDPEIGDERLLPLEEWERVLAPFDIRELKYYGHPQSGDRDHILCVLRGQDVSEELRAMMRVAKEPYPPGISAIVHTRDEERHIAACLETLTSWTDEIIVCDMESSDKTVEIAQGYTDNIVWHPLISNFDGARNVSAMRARYRWVFYLDADERVPPGLGQALRQLTCKQGDGDALDGDTGFEALLPPFRHYFAGHWLQSLYPGYTAPRLFKNGKFVFNARLHAGAEVDGRISCFPADNPDLALMHHSFDSLSHYLTKLNRYTDGEAENMHRDGQTFGWQNAIRHFASDLHNYYDQSGAHRDGVHGLVYSFLSAFYRFEQHAKLYERRYRSGQLQPGETSVPVSAEQILEYALSVVREKPSAPLRSIHVRPGEKRNLNERDDSMSDAVSQSDEAVRDIEVGPDEVNALPKQNAELVTDSDEAMDPIPISCTAMPEMVWCGPLFDPSGYGEEVRNFALASDAAGLAVAAQELPWSQDRADIAPEEQTRLQALAERAVSPGFAQVIQNFPTGYSRHPQAGLCIGRTMFETDRLPREWVKGCNAMDYIWVPSEFNRQTFQNAGVAPEKLVVMPGCLDAAPWRDEKYAKREAKAGDAPFIFLTVFDWTLHKGWDVLLRAFLEEFKGEANVSLALKVWSTMGYNDDSIREQAYQWAKEHLDHDLEGDTRIRFVSERLNSEAMRELYFSSDAFVLPSRGEGWGRPYMEAMAAGLPGIGTNWSGNTAFMTADNSYLLDCTLEDIPEIGWREIPTYRGHRWAEPDTTHLRSLLRRVFVEREEGIIKGQRARADVLSRFSREAVGSLIVAELKKATGKNPAPDLGSASGVVSVPDSLALPQASVPKIAVRWEGEAFQWHSLAHVNRELCLGLMDSGKVDLSLVTDGPQTNGPLAFDLAEDPRFSHLASRWLASLSHAAQVHVRHGFPPRLQSAPEGHLVLIQPWEYGYLPAQWLEPIRDNVREVWCYSEYVRDVYRNSGIAEDKLHVVPLGVDETVFAPLAPPYVFTVEPGAARFQEGRKKPFVFLFAGGTIHRKGFDILLEAYLKAFSAYDNVCLLVKDTGTATVYRGHNHRERLIALAQDPSRPLIVYVEDDLSAHAMAGIYTASDCLVMPYRGEGFLLPALEALACGVPVIVTGGDQTTKAPTDDFVDESVGWRVAAEKRPFGSPRVGEWEFCGPAWQFEVDPHVLASRMRYVFGNSDEAKAKGEVGAGRVRAGWTWCHATRKALKRLDVLSREPIKEKPVGVKPPTIPARQAKKAQSRSGQGAGEPELSDSPSKSAIIASAPPASRPAKPSVKRVLVPAIAKPDLPPRPAPTISLCMIVRNEERVLDACLQSAKPYVDEIIVVDTGSTDATVAIAQSHGAKMRHFPWTDSFSEARNISLEQATGDWLFWMDADDTLPPECGEKLRELAFTAPDETTGFLMQVHIPPAPGEEGFTIVDHLKLFRNLPGLRFEGRIHEQILEPLYRIGGQVERSDAYVVHSGYDYSSEGQHRKRERDLLLLRKDLDERPGHPFVLFNIGMTAHHLKEWDKAIAALDECLARSKPFESTVRKAYAMLASSYLAKGEITRAVEQLEKGLALFPRDPELLFRAGIIFREAGDLQRAEQSYLALLTSRETGHIDSLDVSMTGFKAHHNLALIYQDMNRWSEAEAQFRVAVQSNPQFVPSWLGLGEVYRQMQRFAEAETVAAMVEQITTGGPAAAPHKAQ